MAKDPLRIPSEDFSRVGVAEFRQRMLARIARVGRQAQRMRSSSPPSLVLVHAHHKDLRALRLELHLWEEALRPGSRRPVQRTLATIEALLEDVGRLRDLQVIEQRLSMQARPIRHRPWSVPETWTKSLKEGSNEVWRSTAKRERKLETQLHSLPGKIGVPATVHRVERAIDLQLKEGRKELSGAIQRARSRPSRRNLHRVRITLRRARLVRRSVARRLAEAEFSSGWQRLQAELGTHHDLGVLEEWVRGQPEGAARKKLRSSLRRQLKHRRNRLQDVLVSEKDPTER